MKFSVKGKSLLTHLNAAYKAIASKPTLAILSCFMFDLEGKTLRVTASDTDTFVTVNTEVESSEGNIRVCVAAKRFLELLKMMPDGLLWVDVNPATHAITISHERGKYDLAGQDVIDFPTANMDADDNASGPFTISGARIIEAIDKVGFAVSADEFRLNMQGICWDVTENDVTFVATDTRMLAKYTVKNVNAGITTNFVLHSRVFPLVRSLVTKDANVTVTVTPTAIRFTGDNFSLQTAKVNGKYPDYNRVIPANLPFEAEVDRVGLMAACERVSLCSDPQHSLVKVDFSPMDITISAEDVNFRVGGRESLACNYSGEPMTVGFSGTGLKNTLKSILAQDVTVKLADPRRPVVFVPGANEENTEFLALIAPMTLNGK